MYGLLIEGLKQYVEKVYGQELWESVLRQYFMKMKVFNTNNVYPECVIPSVIDKIASETGISAEQTYHDFGYHFIVFLTESGYDRLLRVLGRSYLNFLQSLNELHHYLRLSYPKIKSPSFNVLTHTHRVIELRYTTFRNPNYNHFVRGQLSAVASVLYSLDVDVTLVRTEVFVSHHRSTYMIVNKGVCSWDNGGTITPVESMLTLGAIAVDRSTSTEVMLSLLPFHILFDDSGLIRRSGVGFDKVGGQLVGKRFDQCFKIARPVIENTFEKVVPYSKHFCLEF